MGPTGTGKTATIANYLGHELDLTKYQTITVNFSAQTSSSQTQSIIDRSLDRRRRGVFGPAQGKRGIIFVDDLNLPAREHYGAQPPIELLRQWVDHEGWYDVHDASFKNLVELQLISSMGPPGGGRHPVTTRFLRHFSTLTVTPFESETLKTIFGSILDWHFATQTATSPPFSGEIHKLSGKLVAATAELYHTAMTEVRESYCYSRLHLKHHSSLCDIAPSHTCQESLHLQFARFCKGYSWHLSLSSRRVQDQR